MKQPVIAYLTDKTGHVHETLTIRSKNPKKDVEAMNGTCRAFTDGKLFWTLAKQTIVEKTPDEKQINTGTEAKQCQLSL